MAKLDIMTALTALAAVIALLVGLIANMTKLKDFVKGIISRARSRRTKRMGQLLQQQCEAFLKLPMIIDELESHKILLVAIVRDRIMQKTRFHLAQGFIPDIDAELLLSDFLDYHCNQGNGPVLHYVTETMRLPRIKNGPPTNFDMGLTIEREIFKRSCKKGD